MKKIIAILGMVSLLSACNNEPKLDQHEDQAVEDILAADQKSMDSLEAAIKAQMDELNADSAEMDSL